MPKTLPQAVLDQQARAELLSDQLNEVLEEEQLSSMDILDCLAESVTDLSQTPKQTAAMPIWRWLLETTRRLCDKSPNRLMN